MTDWYHKVDRRWMEARAKYLNASAIKEMLPVTETGRKRSQAQREAAMMKAWSHHLQTHIPEEALESRGAAARGHILEPFALNEYQRCTGESSVYHWDDVVIHDKYIGWSPDGMSIPQVKDYGCSWDVDERGRLCAETIFEVKSYSIEKHVAKLHEGVHEERWQLAVGMYLQPQTQRAVLIFFNPDCSCGLAYNVYKRSDLEEEIEMIRETVDDYLDWTKTLAKSCTGLYMNLPHHSSFYKQLCCSSINPK